MATEVETLQQQVDDRIDAIINLKSADETTAAELAEAKQLDKNLQGDQSTFGGGLEGLYKEKRHYSGKEPLVYTQSQTDVYPFYQGAVDTDGNPYFRPSLVIAGSDKGIKPIFSEPTRTGPVGYNRDGDYAPTEDVNRVPVIQPLKDYPVLTGEPLPPNFPNAAGTNGGVDQCFYAVGVDEPTCTGNGGEWVLNGDPIPDPTWIGPDTAPGVLRPFVTAWKDDVQIILDDVYLDDLTTESFWQSIIDECNTFLGLLPADAVFVRNDPNPDPATWGQTPTPAGALLTSLNNLILLSETSTPAFVISRDSDLDGRSEVDEQTYFGIINLRLHQVNGSYARVKSLENQAGTNVELIEDHQEALDTLNRLIISKS